MSEEQSFKYVVRDPISTKLGKTKKKYIIDFMPEAKLEHVGKISGMAKSNVGTISTDWIFRQHTDMSTPPAFVSTRTPAGRNTVIFISLKYI